MTLDCLRYVGYIQGEDGNKKAAIIMDDRKQEYLVRVGDRIGNHFGVLIAIHPRYLVIQQFIYRDNRYIKKRVRINREDVTRK